MASLPSPPTAWTSSTPPARYAGGSLGGLDNVDLWIGGLAEKVMPFGGMLGSTFNFVFEVQLEKLQDGDRFYYLQRLDGLHLLSEMENNTFAKVISLNADAGHLPSDVFSTPGLILEVDQSKQWNPGLGSGRDPTRRQHPHRRWSCATIRRPPGSEANYLRYTGTDHVLLGRHRPGTTPSSPAKATTPSTATAATTASKAAPATTSTSAATATTSSPTCSATTSCAPAAATTPSTPARAST